MSDEGYNEVTIHVNADDTGKATRDKIKTEYEELGKKSYTIPIKATDPINDAWRAKVQAEIKAIGKEALKIPMDPDSAQFRAEVASTLAELKSIAKEEVPLDMVDADKFRMSVESMVASVQAEVSHGIQVPVQVQNTKAVVPDLTAADQPSGKPYFRAIDQPVHLYVDGDPYADVKAKLAGEPEPELLIKATDPINAAWLAKVESGIKAAAKESLNIPVTPDTAEYRAELAFQLESIRADVKQGIPADLVEQEKFKAQALAMVEEIRAEVHARIPVEVDESKLSEVENTLNNEVSKAAGNAGRGGGGALATAIAAGVVLGAPLIGGALDVAVGASMIGLAGLVEKNNTQVQDSFRSLGHNVVQTMKNESDQAIPYLTQAASTLSATMDGLGNDIAKSMYLADPATVMLTESVRDLATNAMPGFQIAAGASGAAAQGLDLLMGDLGNTFTDTFTTLSTHSTQFAGNFDATGHIIQSAVDAVSHVLGDLSTMYTGHAGQLTGLFSNLDSTITHLSSGAVPMLSGELGGFLTIANGILSVLGPIDTQLGAVAGVGLEAYSSFKLFSTIGDPIASAGSKMKSTAGSAGEMATAMTGSAMIGNATEKAMSGLGTAVSKAGQSLPLLGTAFILADQGAQSLFGTTDQLKSGMQDTGDAYMKASGQLHANDAAVQSASGLWSVFGDVLKTFVPTSESVNQQIQQQQDKLSQVQRLQGDTNLAMQEYNVLVREYGKDSPQALDALSTWASDTNNVSAAQEEENRQLRTGTQIIEDNTTAMLGAVSADLSFQSSLLGIQSAQQTYTDAVKKHGATSLQAQQAENAYQQSLLSSVNAAGAKSAADDVGATKAQALIDKTNGETAQILALAAAAGNSAPPALQQMVAGLTQTQIAAFESTGKLDGTHQAVVNIPGYKPITINVDNATGMARIAQTQHAIDALHGTVLNTYVNIIERVQAPANAPGLSLIPGGAFPRANGGNVGGMDLPRFATGGFPGMGSFLAGEHGAEIVQAPIGSRVLPAANTQQALAGSVPGPARVEIFFGGDSNSAFATLFQMLLRTGTIQIRQSQIQTG